MNIFGIKNHVNRLYNSVDREQAAAELATEQFVDNLYRSPIAGNRGCGKPLVQATRTAFDSAVRRGLGQVLFRYGISVDRKILMDMVDNAWPSLIESLIKNESRLINAQDNDTAPLSEKEKKAFAEEGVNL